MAKYDVIVIGAGVAGLTAAQQLEKSDLRVLVLEAADYVGGRIKTAHDWDLPVELGAEFIHGTNTAAADLANHIGLTLIPAHEDRKLVDVDGRLLSHQEKIPYNELMEYIATHGKRGVSVADIIKNNPITQDKTICRLASLSVGDYEAGDADSLDSGAYSEMEKRTQNDNTSQLLKDGYQQIVANLADGLTIRLHSIVISIDYSEETSVAITLSSGEVFYAPKIIVTVSLGVLQHEMITFTPRLSKDKRDVIHKLGMGNAMKCIIKLKDPQDITALFRYADGDNESLQTITCWWASGSNPKVLVGYCGGSRAAAALALGKERLVEKVLEDLGKILGKNIVDQLVDYKVVRWDTNPYTFGAYSNHPVGTGNQDRKALAKPIDNRIYWAGEACVTDGNYATVHGAIESGYRVAAEITSNVSA